MTTRFLRQIAVIATVGALAVSSIALPARARPKAERGPKVEHTHKHEAKHEHKTRTTNPRGKSAAAKARKAARFQANGTLLGVVDNTILVAVKGGSAKSLRGQIAAFDVTDAVINRDDVAATVADLVAGDHVAVKGVKVDGVYAAKRVNAASPEPVTEDPTEDPSEEVTADPTEEVTEDTGQVVTEDPTEEVTADPTEDSFQTGDPVAP